MEAKRAQNNSRSQMKTPAPTLSQPFNACGATHQGVQHLGVILHSGLEHRADVPLLRSTSWEWGLGPGRCSRGGALVATDRTS